MNAVPTIILLGGGFSDNEFIDLDNFLLRNCQSPKPKICFIPTASGDSSDYIARFYAAFGDLNCEPTHLELFRRTVGDLDDFLSSQDAVYVGGGNTANLLAVWRLHGLDSALQRAYENGVILAGISAGSACWFQSCLTDSFGPLSALSDGLGLISGSFCPHFNSEPGRPAIYRDAVDGKELPPGYGLDDGAAALFINGELAQTYRSDSDANIHRLERKAE